MQKAEQAFAVNALDIRKLLTRSIEQGMSVKQLLQGLSLRDTLLDDPKQLIHLADCWRIIIANQNAVQEESHLMATRPLKKGTTRLVFSNLRHCASIGEALHLVAETYNVVHGGDYNFVHKHGHTSSYIVDDRKFHYTGRPEEFAIEFALIRIHCAISILAGSPLKVLRVRTKRKALPAHNHHLNLFGSKCLADQEVYELTYDTALLQQPLKHRHEIDVTGNVYAQFLELRSQQSADAHSDGILLKVNAALRDCAFRSQLPCQHEVAERLNMSVATLRRKLTMANSSFRTIKDDVYAELALNLLEDGIHTKEVSERLGYSDERSFKRAFRRWQGITPATFVRSRAYNNEAQ